MLDIHKKNLLHAGVTSDVVCIAIYIKQHKHAVLLVNVDCSPEGP